MWKDQWHIRLYRDEGSKYILVFNKQQENYKLNQYVQQNACSFATDSGYFWSFLFSFFYILFSELTHKNRRTEMLRLQSSHSVWEAFSRASRMTQTLSSLGWIISLPPGSKSSEEAPCTHYVKLQFSSLRNRGPLAHKAFVFFPGFCPSDNLEARFQDQKTNAAEISVLAIFKTFWVLQNDSIVLVLLIKIFLQRI